MGKDFMTRKLALGLIGGIATGKTTAAHYFKELGAEIIDTDQIARDLVAPETPALQEIVAHFGPEILTHKQELDRAKLREIIFVHPEARTWLENLLHPLIREVAEERVLASKAPYCVVAIPLLKRREDYPFLAKTLFISAPDALRVERLIERDRITEAQAEAIIKAQPKVDDFKCIADYVIENVGDEDQLRKELFAVHQDFLALLS